MVTWEQVRTIALALPETSEGTRWGNPTWFAGTSAFAWERALGTTDLRQLTELGQAAPEGELLAIRVAHLADREALLAEDPAVYLTIPHFKTFAAVLVRLDAIDEEELTEILEDAWLVCAPKAVVEAWRDGREGA